MIGSDPVRRRLRRLSLGERRDEAFAFLREYAREVGLTEACYRERSRQIGASLRTNGHYDHTSEELTFGARIAWRNHGRCIGRLWWKSLEVVDCRHVVEPGAIAARLFAHMRYAFASGRVRSVLTVFAPVIEDRVPATIESSQALQYAGYFAPGGKVVGDRRNVETTRIALALGWRPPEPHTPFDILPLFIRDATGRRHLFSVPNDLIHEVLIAHPDLPEIAGLGMRWYAVPTVSNMVLTIGGIEYPCAPFNGHYMATEIASRNLTDPRRYDLLPQVVNAIRPVDAPASDSLWLDRALTELNRAVLWSFERDGIAITDHHEASRCYMEFVKREQAAGRVPSGDWSWIVPPQAGSACPVFHLPMVDKQGVPNFYLSRAVDGGMLQLDRSHERRGRWLRLHDRMKARWRKWRRHRDGLWR